MNLLGSSQDVLGRRLTKQLSDRLMINKGLNYGFCANLFAYAMFIMLVSPSFVKKLAYKIFR